MFEEIYKHIKNKSKVISLQYGIGEIVGNFAMYDGIDDYIEVDFQLEGKTKFICVRNLSDIRLLSSRESIDEALILLSKRLCDHNINNDFIESNAKFIDKDAMFIARRIVNLSRKNDLSPSESLLLNSSLESLVSEIKEVYCVDHNCARGMVSDHLKCA